MSPRTVLEIHGDWHNLLDAYVSTPLGSGGWGSIWTNNAWYAPYQTASVGVPVYFPDMNIGGNGFGGGGFYWNQAPKGEASSVKIAQQRGSHYIKAGFEQRESYGLSYVSSTSNFYFNSALTANTFNNPDTLHNGSPYATFLLGALDGSSQMIGGPVPDPHVRFYGMYIQDDWKLSPKITLNLGLRDEYETALYDPQHNFSQGLDLSPRFRRCRPVRRRCRRRRPTLWATTSISGTVNGPSPVRAHPGIVQPAETCTATARRYRVPHRRQDGFPRRLCAIPDSLRNEYRSGAGFGI